MNRIEEVFPQITQITQNGNQVKWRHPEPEGCDDRDEFSCSQKETAPISAAFFLPYLGNLRNRRI